MFSAKKLNDSEKINQDEDVSNEGRRIEVAEREGKTFILKTDQLTKVYVSNYGDFTVTLHTVAIAFFII